MVSSSYLSKQGVSEEWLYNMVQLSHPGRSASQSGTNPNSWSAHWRDFSFLWGKSECLREACLGRQSCVTREDGFPYFKYWPFFPFPKEENQRTIISESVTAGPRLLNKHQGPTRGRKGSVLASTVWHQAWEWRVPSRNFLLILLCAHQ